MNSVSGSPPDPILSKKQVATWIGVDISSLDRWSKAGTFPVKMRLGPGRVGWPKSAVEAWLAAR